jgi:tetratricopeptide (TPR) repeat protein
MMLLVAAAVLLVAGLAGAWLGGARLRRALQPASEIAKPKPFAQPKALVKPLPPVKIMPTVTPVPSASSPVPDAFVASRPSHEPRAAVAGSASELFARANLLRRQGRVAEAAVLYELLLDLYPNSREVGPARLALAKYLQARQPERALSQYRAVAGGGGALRAEALWGISEIATAQGRPAVAEQALADLLREFPDSPYAEVARARSLHDSH